MPSCAIRRGSQEGQGHRRRWEPTPGAPGTPLGGRGVSGHRHTPAAAGGGGEGGVGSEGEAGAQLRAGGVVPGPRPDQGTSLPLWEDSAPGEAPPSWEAAPEHAGHRASQAATQSRGVGPGPSLSVRPQRPSPWRHAPRGCSPDAGSASDVAGAQGARVGGTASSPPPAGVGVPAQPLGDSAFCLVAHRCAPVCRAPSPPSPEPRQGGCASEAPGSPSAAPRGAPPSPSPRRGCLSPWPEAPAQQAGDTGPSSPHHPPASPSGPRHPPSPSSFRAGWRGTQLWWGRPVP